MIRHWSEQSQKGYIMLQISHILHIDLPFTGLSITNSWRWVPTVLQLNTNQRRGTPSLGLFGSRVDNPIRDHQALVVINILYASIIHLYCRFPRESCILTLAAVVRFSKPSLLGKPTEKKEVSFSWNIMQKQEWWIVKPITKKIDLAVDQPMPASNALLSCQFFWQGQARESQLQSIVYLESRLYKAWKILCCLLPAIISEAK